MDQNEDWLNARRTVSQAVHAYASYLVGWIWQVCVNDETSRIGSAVYTSRGIILPYETATKRTEAREIERERGG